MSFNFHLGLEGGGALLTEDERPILLYSFANDNNVDYALQVDWDGDGVLDDFNEADFMIAPYMITRGRERNIGAAGQGFEPYRVGTMTLTLDNSNGRYNYYNTASPLYGKLEPGKRMKFNAAIYSTDSTSGYITQDIFTGTVTGIEMSGWNKTVTIVCEDGFGLLNTTNLSLSVRDYYNYSTHITVSDVVDRVITESGYPYGYTASTDDPLASSDYILRTIWQDDAALDELEQLANAFAGSIAAERDGNMSYHSIYEADASIATLTDSILLDTSQYPNPWEYNRDQVVLDANVLFRHGSGYYYVNSDKPILFSAGTTITETLSPKPYLGSNIYSDNIFVGASSTSLNSISVASATTDAVFNLLGTTDISYSVDYGLTESAFTITNNSSTDGYIMSISAGGEFKSDYPYSIDATKEYVYGTAGNVGNVFRISGSKYLFVQKYLQYADGGTKTIRRDEFFGATEAQESRLDAIGNLLINYFSNGAPHPIVQIEGRPSLQFLLDVEKRVTYNSSLLGVNADYRIAGIKHQTLGTTQAVRTTVYLYPVIPSST